MLFLKLAATCDAGGAHAWPTLAEVLSKAEQPKEGFSDADLAQRMPSYASLRDGSSFFLAGYMVPGDEIRGEIPLHVWHVVRSPRKMTHETIDKPWLGDVASIRRVGRFLLVGLHHSPSSVTDLVLSEDLGFHDHLLGHSVVAVDDRRVVVWEGQPHFSWGFETFLDLYDLEERRGIRIFPPVPPGNERRDLMAVAAEAYRSAGQDWCRENNEPCDSSRLESELDSPAVFNPATDALCVVVHYDIVPSMLGSFNRRDNSCHVAYIYRHVHSGTLECREVPLRERPDEAELSALVSSSNLRLLFRARD